MGKDADRDREDRELFKHLKIVFRGRSPEWPLHHLTTCQKISILGSQRYSTYCSDEDGSKFWREETKSHAQQLVDTVCRLTRNQSSEMQWRLDIEKIVFKRLEFEIKCPEPDCGNRLWRSEIEAEPEASNEFTRSLEKRRRERIACSCPAKVRLQNKGGEAHFELRPRKPDRVHGLQQTKFFTQARQALTADIQMRTMEAATAAGVDETLTAFQFTPFEDRARPLVFPYLISETKTERGDSFEACERQTAFPIWNLLKLQENLQVCSQQRLEEQGGPFVWFFANRGEEWRLYGCFTDIEEDDIDPGVSYIIQDIWTGRLDSQDGALQILLLIDYISDWGRDIYRPSIARLLKRVVDNTSRRERDETESIQLGTDFSSMAPRVADWQDQMDLDPPSLESSPLSELSELPPPPETPYLCEEEFEEWQNTDTVAGVFRDASILQTGFECVYFENDIFTTLLAPFVTSQIPEERLTQLVSAIHNAFLRYAVTISDYVLDQLEELWTGHERLEDETRTRPTHAHAIMVYYTHISEKLQPRRAIACIVIEKEVFRKIQEESTDPSTSLATGSGILLKDVTSSDVTGLIPALFQVLGTISSDGPRGSIEDIIRFSNIVEHQRIDLVDGKRTIFPYSQFSNYPLTSISGSRIKSVLVYCKYLKEVNELGPEWCLFCLEPNEVPNLERQFELLTELWKEDGFYSTTYFLSRASPKGDYHWWSFNGWNPDIMDANGALSQWKAMLEDLHTIKQVASLVESEPLAVSRFIKRSMAGRTRKREMGAIGSGLKSWDMFKVKREFMDK
ncbi:hypothetical protein V8E51_015678 [Hyaloscypha variabilis]